MDYIELRLKMNEIVKQKNKLKLLKNNLFVG